jgi:hypothetical protein
VGYFLHLQLLGYMNHQMLHHQNLQMLQLAIHKDQLYLHLLQQKLSLKKLNLNHLYHYFQEYLEKLHLGHLFHLLRLLLDKFELKLDAILRYNQDLEKLFSYRLHLHPKPIRLQ